nr:membrane protein insertion efficiency factor YidD [uncultured Celeribacter sp.]
MTPLAYLISLPVRAYRLTFSPWIGYNCRYQPTCSAYAMEALEKHGAIKGTYLTIRRLGRCHPLGGSGYDPVPPCGHDHGAESTPSGSKPATTEPPAPETKE